MTDTSVPMTNTFFLVGMPPDDGFITLADRIPIFINLVDAYLYSLMCVKEYPELAGKVGTFTIVSEDVSTERFIESCKQHNEKFCLYQGLMVLQAGHEIKAWIKFNNARPYPCAKTTPVSVDVFKTGVNICDGFPHQTNPETLREFEAMVKASADLPYDRLVTFCNAALTVIEHRTVFFEEPSPEMTAIQLLMRPGQRLDDVSTLLTQATGYH